MTNLANKQSRPILCLGQNAPGIRLRLFFSDSTADSSTSLSRAASEWKQASIVRSKATDFLVQKGRRSERGWVPPEGDPMECRLPGSSICGIFQARILEWVAVSLYITFHIDT